MAGRAPPDGYRRDLPHLQSDGATIFVTFSTTKRLIILPPEARDITLEHLLFENDRKHHVHIAVVMPEHVHMITTPLPGPDRTYRLFEIMKSIKGVSARRINKLMRRTGHGVGTDHLPYLEAEKGELGIQVLRGIQKYLDPAGMMNPGKLM